MLASLFSFSTAIFCFAAIPSFPPAQNLHGSLDSLESSSAKTRDAAERFLREFPALLSEEAALRGALEKQGPETRHRLSRVLANRDDAFPVLLRWLQLQGSVRFAAEGALREIYRGFRGGKIPPPAKRGELGEAPQDAMRRARVRIPEGVSFLSWIETMHRKEWLTKPLLLAPEVNWEAWQLRGDSQESELGILSERFMKLVETAPSSSAGKRSLQAYAGFLWLSVDREEETEEEIFLRLCRALRSENGESRRIAALNLGRLGFGPAEKFFADAMIADDPLAVDWCLAFFGGQGVSPWLLDPKIKQALDRLLPKLEKYRESIRQTLERQ